jgi:hypothetical protein
MNKLIMQQALDALRRVGEYGDIYRHKNTEQSPFTQIYEAIDALNIELAKPEPTQEQIYEIIIRWDSSGKRSRRELARRIKTLFTEPRAHITDGTPCWCNPIKELAEPEQWGDSAISDPVFLKSQRDINGAIRQLATLEQKPMAWRNAAIRLGEDLYSVGPNGYYEMTAKQWLDWALNVVNTAPRKPEQKPVKCTCDYAIGHPLMTSCSCKPRKTWVGLTDDELNLIYAEPQTHVGQYARAIEAKLKEKNNAV